MPNMFVMICMFLRVRVNSIGFYYMSRLNRVIRIDLIELYESIE